MAILLPWPTRSWICWAVLPSNLNLFYIFLGLTLLPPIFLVSPILDKKNILFNVLHMSPGLDPFSSGCFQPDGLYIGIWEATFGLRFFLFFFFIRYPFCIQRTGGKKAFGMKLKRKKNDLHFSFVISYNAMVACMYTTGDVFSMFFLCL